MMSDFEMVGLRSQWIYNEHQVVYECQKYLYECQTYKTKLEYKVEKNAIWKLLFNVIGLLKCCK